MYVGDSVGAFFFFICFKFKFEFFSRVGNCKRVSKLTGNQETVKNNQGFFVGGNKKIESQKLKRIKNQMLGCLKAFMFKDLCTEWDCWIFLS